MRSTTRGLIKTAPPAASEIAEALELAELSVTDEPSRILAKVIPVPVVAVLVNCRVPAGSILAPVAMVKACKFKFVKVVVPEVPDPNIEAAVVVSDPDSFILRVVAEIVPL